MRSSRWWYLLLVLLVLLLWLLLLWLLLLWLTLLLLRLLRRLQLRLLRLLWLGAVLLLLLLLLLLLRLLRLRTPGGDYSGDDGSCGGLRGSGFLAGCLRYGSGRGRRAPSLPKLILVQRRRCHRAV